MTFKYPLPTTDTKLAKHKKTWYNWAMISKLIKHTKVSLFWYYQPPLPSEASRTQRNAFFFSVKSNIKAGGVTQPIKQLRETLASHMYTTFNPGCSNSAPVAVPGRAEDGPCAGLLPVPWESWVEVTAPSTGLAHAQPLQSFEEWTKEWKSFPIFPHLSLSLTFKFKK